MRILISAMALALSSVVFAGMTSGSHIRNEHIRIDTRTGLKLDIDFARTIQGIKDIDFHIRSAMKGVEGCRVQVVRRESRSIETQKPIDKSCSKENSNVNTASDKSCRTIEKSCRIEGGNAVRFAGMASGVMNDFSIDFFHIDGTVTRIESLLKAADGMTDG